MIPPLVALRLCATLNCDSKVSLSENNLIKSKIVITIKYSRDSNQSSLAATFHNIILTIMLVFIVRYTDRADISKIKSSARTPDMPIFHDLLQLDNYHARRAR